MWTLSFLLEIYLLILWIVLESNVEKGKEWIISKIVNSFYLGTKWSYF